MRDQSYAINIIVCIWNTVNDINGGRAALRRQYWYDEIRIFVWNPEFAFFRLNHL